MSGGTKVHSLLRRKRPAKRPFRQHEADNWVPRALQSASSSERSILPDFFQIFMTESNNLSEDGSVLHGEGTKADMLCGGPSVVPGLYLIDSAPFTTHRPSSVATRSSSKS
jgi:hypothetical protein